MFKTDSQISPIQINQNSRRRGRPCAIERYNNELMQQKLTNMISNPNLSLNDEFTRLNVIPFIVKRQRRVRANDRERNRMQTLNEALEVLKQHLPIEFLLIDKGNSEDLDTSSNSNFSSSGNSSKKKSESKLTKIDTLRMATRYISILTETLNQGTDNTRATNFSLSQTSSFTSSESSSSSPNYSTMSMNEHYHHQSPVTHINDNFKTYECPNANNFYFDNNNNQMGLITGSTNSFNSGQNYTYSNTGLLKYDNNSLVHDTYNQVDHYNQNGAYFMNTKQNNYAGYF